MRFAKGHGTENDFVILPDPDAALALPAARVAALCDRRAGIGADGVLRVVRTDALVAAGEVAADARLQGAEWFMDYRNADGSVAEMCGNGVRVFARYLAEEGLAEKPRFVVATRAGARELRLEDDGEVTADMGEVRLGGESTAELRGGPLRGRRVSVGNPHLVCRAPGGVDAVDFGRPPRLDPADFPDGGNVEVYTESAPGELRMRVFERGSGETRSCGTGIVAVAATAAQGREGTWRVAVPGGRCTVVLGPAPDEGAAGRRAWLRGPAVIVAEGTTRL